MRLINVDTHALENFGPSTLTPPYAILSHTWSTEEVSFADWQADPSEHEGKLGYAKAVEACRQAQQDGLNYVWVDTCCIDKANNTELSESINSMYKWYELAKVCYVHLADVQVEAAESDGMLPADSAHTSTTSTLRDLRRCRYFSRGWTLQELLAPHTVRFYASNWTFLGELEGKLAQVISKRTGIDVLLLTHHKKLDDFSIPQKLSWASLRETTRVEDRAYSLLGLLHVSLDMRYGEGDRAFYRLQQEILKQPHGLSVLAWLYTDDKRPTDLLASSPDDFADSSDMIFDASMSLGSEIWTTSAGIKGTVTVVEPRGQHTSFEPEFVVLGCHYELSDENMLALRVARNPTSDESSGVVYTVDILEDGRMASAAMTRLAEIEFLCDAKVYKTEVTILWQGKAVDKDSSMWHRRRDDNMSHSRRLASPRAGCEYRYVVPLRACVPLAPRFDSTSIPTKYTNDQAMELDKFERPGIAKALQDAQESAGDGHIGEDLSRSELDDVWQRGMQRITKNQGGSARGLAEHQEAKHHQHGERSLTGEDKIMPHLRDQKRTATLKTALNAGMHLKEDAMSSPSGSSQVPDLPGTPPKIWFQVDQMKPSDDSCREPGPKGQWRPPRRHRGNVLLPGHTTGKWYEWSDWRVQESPRERRNVPYGTFSFYHDNGKFWIWPSDATRYQIGENSDGEDSEDEEDCSENDISDSRTEDWQALTFDGESTSFATIRGRSDTMPVWPEDDVSFYRRLLPDRYLDRDPGRQMPRGSCGLTGKLPILIALIAYSVFPAKVDATLRKGIGRFYSPPSDYPMKGCKCLVDS